MRRLAARSIAESHTFSIVVGNGDILCSDRNELHGRNTDILLIQGDNALDGQAIDRRPAMPADTIRRGLFSHGGGFRLDGNPGSPRNGSLCHRNDANLRGDEAQGRVAISS